MLIEFGRAGWIDKARQQPEKVKQVLDKVRTDGVLPTLDAVQAKLDQPIALGYCNAGSIAEGPQRGKRVVSNGPHAEYVCVPENLCAEVPDSVSDEAAAFGVAGAIGMQGIRLVAPTMGECFVVIGLGLIGLLTVQLLQANGCRVMGIDLDPAKCDLARRFGADAYTPLGDAPYSDAVADFSQGRGVDGVLITAATQSSAPVHQAARMCRKRGRIVMVGVTGLELNRSDFYEKELTFQVSCSYGPGRYDAEYEEKGHDYPIGFVRWTEQRNFEAVLDLMAAGKLDVAPLITHRFAFSKAEDAYRLIAEGREPYLGILLEYPVESPKTSQDDSLVSLVRSHNRMPSRLSTPIVGVIGAGNFTGQVILPALRETPARLKAIASGKGVTGTHLGRKFGFETSTTDSGAIMDDPEIDTVFITTRHDTHGPLVLEALSAGKHIFVEKPLCLNSEELDRIGDARGPDRHLMVGFNRRFSPFTKKTKELLHNINSPKSFVMTVNAGHIPRDHWTQDPAVGGGRVIGEACHFIDLLRFLAGCRITRHHFETMAGGAGDTITISLAFEDGSIGSVHYFANGHKSFPKERLEVFCGGKILRIDNFRRLTGYGWSGFKGMKTWRQDKGHRLEVAAFIQAIAEGGPTPIPFEEIEEVSRVTLQSANI